MNARLLSDSIFQVKNGTTTERLKGILLAN